MLPLEAPRVTRKTLELYHANVPSFDASELASSERMGRRGWLCAGGLGLLAGGLGLALYGTARENVRLAKGWEVRALVVDKTTGESFQVKDAEGLPEGAVENHTKHMVWQYVMAREGYSRPEDKRRFDLVVAMSDMARNGEQTRFKKWWEEAPDGPRKQLGENGLAEVELRADTELHRDDPKATKGPYTHAVAHLTRWLERPRFERTEQRVRATLFFGWDEGMRRSDELAKNPFGFVVHRYIRSWA